MKNIRQRLALVLCVCLLFTLSACGEKNGETVRLSFKSASSYDYLQTLDGKVVTINGYMATSSPADGSFLFLMNLPYQSCPFCKPNTTQLSNTMEVYPKNNEKFGYTTQAIRVTGTLAVAPAGKPFSDPYGYEFSFKLVDAEYTILKSEELSADMALWQKVAESDIVNDLYGMYDYLNFLCAWNTYVVNSYVSADGNLQTGYYLYAADALNYVTKDGAQFNYGYKDGYFDGLVKRVQAIDPDAFSDLCANIREAEALAGRARAALENGEYTYEYQYVERFNTEDYVYTINEGEAFVSEYERIYLVFANWLAGWEM
ncbi:MAG: hypothetical protein MJ192_11480 [Clostridia bacterium]|nr:hypothetical protein [Clostridia bacterium]